MEESFKAKEEFFENRNREMEFEMLHTKNENIHKQKEVIELISLVNYYKHKETETHKEGKTVKKHVEKLEDRILHITGSKFEEEKAKSTVVADLERIADGLKHDNSKMKSKNEDLERKIQSCLILNKEVNKNTNESMDKLRDEIASLKEQLVHLGQQKAELAQKYEGRIAGLNNEIAQAKEKAKNDNLLSLNSYHKTSQMYQKELDKKTEALKDSLKKLSENQKRNHDISSQIESINRKIPDIYRESAEQLKETVDRIRKGIYIAVLKTSSSFESLENSLSCLRCFEFLQDPLLLNCGHSICKNCFSSHTDIKFPEAMTYCEDCQVKTLNKDISKSNAIQSICDRFIFAKMCLEEVDSVVSSNVNS